MNTVDLAFRFAKNQKLKPAQKYDAVQREYDELYEVIALIADPTYSIEDFEGREMLFPKRWCTLAVVTEKELLRGNVYG
jgi:hypothetical protein